MKSDTAKDQCEKKGCKDDDEERHFFKKSVSFKMPQIFCSATFV